MTSSTVASACKKKKEKQKGKNKKALPRKDGGGELCNSMHHTPPFAEFTFGRGHTCASGSLAAHCRSNYRHHRHCHCHCHCHCQARSIQLQRICRPALQEPQSTLWGLRALPPCLQFQRVLQPRSLWTYSTRTAASAHKPHVSSIQKGYLFYKRQSVSNGVQAIHLQRGAALVGAAVAGAVAGAAVVGGCVADWPRRTGSDTYGSECTPSPSPATHVHVSIKQKATVHGGRVRRRGIQYCPRSRIEAVG